MSEPTYSPRWHCRLHLWHKWRLRPVSGGKGYYSECRYCGKYNGIGTAGGGQGPGDVGGSAAGADVPLG